MVMTHGVLHVIYVNVRSVVFELLFSRVNAFCHAYISSSTAFPRSQNMNEQTMLEEVAVILDNNSAAYAA